METHLDFYDGCSMVYIGEDVYYTTSPAVMPQVEPFSGPACEGCGKEIPKERLEVLPGTTTCVKCSNVREYQVESELGEFVISHTEEELERMGFSYE